MISVIAVILIILATVRLVQLGPEKPFNDKNRGERDFLTFFPVLGIVIALAWYGISILNDNYLIEKSKIVIADSCRY